MVKAQVIGETVAVHRLEPELGETALTASIRGFVEGRTRRNDDGPVGVTSLTFASEIVHPCAERDRDARFPMRM